MSAPGSSGMTINLGAGEGDEPAIEINGVKIFVPGPPAVRVVVGIIFLVLSLYSFFWISEDAQKRGKSGCLAVLFLVAASWPISILWWLWLRPPLLKPELPPEPKAPPVPPSPIPTTQS